MKLVFSFGGSILAPEKPDDRLIKALSSFLEILSDEHQIAVVVGGGYQARADIKKAKQEGFSEGQCDHVGILATRENAKALAKSLGKLANQDIPETIVDAGGIFGEKILIMGGTEPGHSTDAVAALIADWVRADLLVNATNVAGIYDHDPKINEDAKLLETIKIGDLANMIVAKSMEAGKYALLDLTAVKIIERSKIRTIVVDGRDLANLEDAIEGNDFKGTTIVF